VPEDPTSNRSDIVPTFVGYSPSGNVTAETVRVPPNRANAAGLPLANSQTRGRQVYANFGRVEDFAELEVPTP
jgi:hypothetical protein